MDIFGGNGIVEEYGMMRHVSNLYVANTYEVSLLITAH